MLLCLYTFQEGVQSPPAACTRGERLAAAHASVKRRGAPLWRGAAAQRCLCAAGSPLTGSRAVAGGEVCEFDAEMRRALRAAAAQLPKLTASRLAPVAPVSGCARARPLPCV
jgi:hypothetical protein